MYDKERIGITVRNIRDYFKRLDDVKVRSVSDLDDFKFDVISMRIFFIINKTIDLAKEVVISNNFGFPKSYKEIFTLLKKGKLINKKQENDLAKLVILRNKISHRYEGLDEEELFKARNGLKKVVEDFIKIVIKEMSSDE